MDEIFIYKITEANKSNLHKPVNSDRIFYSELYEWFSHNAFRSFGLKYVIENSINYKVEGKEHNVKAGSFMINCKQTDVKVYFENKHLVKSICIDVRPETFAEAYTIMQAKDNLKFDNYLNKYFTYPNFFETTYDIKSCPLFELKLNNLVSNIQNGSDEMDVNQEWFYELVEMIIYQEYGNYLALNGIHSLKTSTKKEILQRVMDGKKYIDENFLTIKDVPEMAAYSCLSEFHFFRSFRQAFSISPYQYLLQKRLEFAKELILKTQLPLNIIASNCNFIDLPTFSKAFKRKFGCAPTKLFPYCRTSAQDSLDSHLELVHS